jgi:amidase
MDGSGSVLTSDLQVSGLGLTWDNNRSFTTTSPFLDNDIRIERSLFSPADANYMRYVDTFTNTGGADRQIMVGWGGDLGSDTGTLVSDTASGDLTIDSTDSWALTIQSSDPSGPAGDPPVGYVVQDPATGVLSSIGDYDSTPFDTAWPGNGNDDLSFVYGPIDLAPGQSVSLAYFLYRGLQENTTGPDGQTPSTGEEIALAQSVLANLAANPDFSGVSDDLWSQMINWNPDATPGGAITSRSIPTLSQWSLLVLVLMMVSAGFYQVRPRQNGA